MRPGRRQGQSLRGPTGRLAAVRARSARAIAVAAAGALLLAAPAGAARPPVLDALNAQRAANGLPAGLTENPQWSANCDLHERYMSLNSYFGHDEDPAKPGYTAGGAEAGRSSVLTTGGWPSAARNPFEDAPIHLMQLLAPALSVTGFSQTGGCVYTWPGYQRPVPAATQYFSYPGPGASGWPARQVTAEFPFTPAELLGLKNPTGPHVYLFTFGPERPKLAGATLRGPGGAAVPVRFLPSVSGGRADGYLPPGGIVIPASPLAAASDYVLAATWSAGGGASHVQTVRFRTAGAAKPVRVPRIRSGFATAGRRATLRIVTPTGAAGRRIAVRIVLRGPAGTVRRTRRITLGRGAAVTVTTPASGRGKTFRLTVSGTVPAFETASARYRAQRFSVSRSWRGR